MDKRPIELSIGLFIFRQPPYGDQTLTILLEEDYLSLIGYVSRDFILQAEPRPRMIMLQNPKKMPLTLGERH